MALQRQHMGHTPAQGRRMLARRTPARRILARPTLACRMPAQLTTPTVPHTIRLHALTRSDSPLALETRQHPSPRPLLRLGGPCKRQRPRGWALPVLAGPPLPPPPQVWVRATAVTTLLSPSLCAVRTCTVFSRLVCDVGLRSRPRAACCLLLAACCLLPAACCLLPAACCLLPAACCLLLLLLLVCWQSPLCCAVLRARSAAAALKRVLTPAPSHSTCLLPPTPVRFRRH